MAESEKELNSLSMKVKEKSEKTGLNSTFKKLRSWHPVPLFHSKQMSLAATGPKAIIHSSGPFSTIHFRFFLPLASTFAGLNYLLGRGTQAFILKVFSLVHVGLRLSQFYK